MMIEKIVRICHGLSARLSVSGYFHFRPTPLWLKIAASPCFAPVACWAAGRRDSVCGLTLRARSFASRRRSNSCWIFSEANSVRSSSSEYSCTSSRAVDTPGQMYTSRNRQKRSMISGSESVSLISESINDFFPSSSIEFLFPACLTLSRRFKLRLSVQRKTQTRDGCPSRESDNDFIPSRTFVDVSWGNAGTMMAMMVMMVMVMMMTVLPVCRVLRDGWEDGRCAPRKTLHPGRARQTVVCRRSFRSKPCGPGHRL